MNQLIYNLKKSLCNWWPAILEVAVVCIFSVLPLFVYILLDIMRSTHSMKETGSEALSRGELFLFAISFSASAWLIANDSPPWQQKRPKKMFYINVVAVLLYVICSIFSVVQRLGTCFTNTDAVIRISTYTFLVAMATLVFACKSRNDGLPIKEADLKEDESTLSDQFAKKVGGSHD